MNSKKNNPNYYGVMTASIRYDKNLTDFEKVLSCDITALCNKDGFCTASNGYFAGLFGKRKETISRAISNLDKQGHFRVMIIRDKVSKRVKERRIYPLIKTSTPIDENDDTPIDENVNTPIDENVKGNTTSLNTNKKINKKEIFRELIEDIKKGVPRKSKVYYSDKAYCAYLKIEDTSQIKEHYIQHQNEKDNFAQTIANFLIDYEANTKMPLQHKPKNDFKSAIDRVFDKPNQVIEFIDVVEE